LGSDVIVKSWLFHHCDVHILHHLKVVLQKNYELLRARQRSTYVDADKREGRTKEVFPLSRHFAVTAANAAANAAGPLLRAAPPDLP